MSKLVQALEAKSPVVTVELDPPKGVDLKPLEELAKGLAARVEAVVVADNPRATARMSPVMTAHKLIRHAGCEVVMTLTCRDRNRLALTSEMLAAAAAGVESLLVVSGDFPTLGDHPGAKPVYDLDSVQALALAAGLNGGSDLGGAELAGAPAFLLGAVAGPLQEPSGPQLIKLRKKQAAGAGVFWTTPLTEAGQYAAFKAAAGDIALIAGVELGDPAGRDQALALIKELWAAGVDGLHLSAPDAPGELDAMLAACGR